MTDALTYLLYGTVFLAILLLIEGLYLLYEDAREARRAVDRRMRMVAAGSEPSAELRTLRRRPIKQVQRLGPLGNAIIHLDRLIARSGLAVSTRRILLIMGLLPFAASLCLVYFVYAGHLSVTPVGVLGWIAASAALGIGLPVAQLFAFKARRLRRFGEQLPEALDIMVRSLHAGHPASAALRLVAKEMPDPIGTEFSIAIDEMTYGLDMRDALENLSRRVELQEFQYVVVAVNIQHESGGNLAEVLRGLAGVIRARFRMLKTIKALSAEGRISAMVLSVLPLAVGALIFAGNPNFYLNVADDPLFKPLLGAAAGLMLAGVYIMHRLVTFRV